MTQPLLIRAAYLHLYFETLRELGVPVDRALARSRLPGLIEEQPDAYVSLPLVLTWLTQTGRELTPMELGFLASGRLSLESFDSTLQAALLGAPTGRACIERYFHLMAIEDSSLKPEIRPEGTNLRLIMDMPRLNRHPHACLADWVNIQAVVTIVRSIVGSGWSPEEITLASRMSVPEQALEAFPNTRMRVDQSCASVLVEANILAQPRHYSQLTEAHTVEDVVVDLETDEWSYRRALREIIQPYIGEGRHDLRFAAELIGTSPRTLQRRLKKSGNTYSSIVDEARFNIAMDNLKDDEVRIVDVAYASGYESPQHFARAFRRQTGLSPTEYRSLNTT